MSDEQPPKPGEGVAAERRSIRSQVSLLRGMLRRPGDRRSIVDEFLAERKAEADRE